PQKPQGHTKASVVLFRSATPTSNQPNQNFTLNDAQLELLQKPILHKFGIDILETIAGRRIEKSKGLTYPELEKILGPLDLTGTAKSGKLLEPFIEKGFLKVTQQKSHISLYLYELTEAGKSAVIRFREKGSTLRGILKQQFWNTDEAVVAKERVSRSLAGVETQTNEYRQKEADYTKLVAITQEVQASLEKDHATGVQTILQQTLRKNLDQAVLLLEEMNQIQRSMTQQKSKVAQAVSQIEEKAKTIQTALTMEFLHHFCSKEEIQSLYHQHQAKMDTALQQLWAEKSPEKKELKEKELMAMVPHQKALQHLFHNPPPAPRRKRFFLF
ncbi:MAG: hypothetical protein K2X66_16630, partial [Cyanobacteria bacterium]|nr:hypothetical protein [Cyanobacteriota bacterium]